MNYFIPMKTREAASRLRLSLRGMSIPAQVTRLRDGRPAVAVNICGARKLVVDHIVLDRSGAVLNGGTL